MSDDIPKKALAWFKWSARDFLVDRQVMYQWSAVHRGIFITLISNQWLEGPLPNDEQILASMCNMYVEDFRDAWPAVKDRFPENEDGLLENRRIASAMAEAIAEAKQRHLTTERLQAAGKKGAARRWSKKQARSASPQVIISEPLNSSAIDALKPGHGNPNSDYSLDRDRDRDREEEEERCAVGLDNPDREREASGNPSASQHAWDALDSMTVTAIRGEFGWPSDGIIGQSGERIFRDDHWTAEEHERVLTIAVQRYVAEGHKYRRPYFESFVKAARDERELELMEE